MITYLLGIPGSGKSYYAVHSIYYNFSKNLKNTKNVFKKDYKTCYTNVNGIKYDQLNHVYSLNWDILESQIIELHALYKKRDKLLIDSEYDTIDDLLIDKASEYNIYKTLFVIDECHNFFDVQRPHLVWWLTYHRHLHHDIFLITQNLALINSKYKSLAERFYKAKPASLSLISKYFYYNYFTDSRMSQASKVEVIKILKNKDVFLLYQSGDSVKTKNVLFRFIGISVFFVILLFLIGFYFYKTKFDKSDSSSSIEVQKNIKSSENKRSATEKVDKKINDIEDIADPVIFVLNCGLGLPCSSDKFDFDLDRKFIFDFLDYYKYKILSVQRIYNGYYRYVLLVNKDFIDLLSTYQEQEQDKEEDKKVTDGLFAQVGNI